MPSHDKPAFYLAKARGLLLHILDSENACVWDEIEAKASDRPWGNEQRSIDPHHLTNAKRELLAEDLIDETVEVSRGGRPVGVFHFKDLTRRETAFEKAAARKRLLHARYRGWASGTPNTPGITGPAAERVAHQSLRAAAPYGYRLQRPAGGEVRQFLGSDVPGGPLDNAAQLLVGAMGEAVIDIPVEVKNLRGWIYPRSMELHQLLYKAAAIQVAHPNRRILPLLVCRRRAFPTFAMGKDLGFYVVELTRQYILAGADLNLDHVEQVRAELGYDLEPIAAGQLAPEHSDLVQTLSDKIPRLAEDITARWAACAPTLLPFFDGLRQNMPDGQRTYLANELRDAARALPEFRVDW